MRLAGNVLYCPLEIDEPFAGVLELRTRFVYVVEVLIPGAPVGQPTAVTEHQARGYQRGSVVMSQILVLVVLDQWPVEIQHTGIDHLQNGIGEHGLAQRGGLEHRLLVHRLHRVAAANPVPPGPIKGATLDDRQLQAGNIGGLHQLDDTRIHTVLRAQACLGKQPASNRQHSHTPAHCARRTAHF